MTEKQANELNHLLHEFRTIEQPFDAKYKIGDWIDEYTKCEIIKICEDIRKSHNPANTNLTKLLPPTGGGAAEQNTLQEQAFINGFLWCIDKIKSSQKTA